MSSTSSSECICPDCFQYGASYRTVQARNPFHMAMGQPLIYYAQLKPQFGDKRYKDSRKRAPNCFVKAFRWYTQEHPAQRAKARQEEGLSEFAMWLDKKYEEFLMENTLPRGAELNSRASSPCEPCQTKIFAKMRSPWSKKHRSTERSEVIEKHLQSLEFIMEPKELSRPASECCPQSPPIKRSKLSIVSSESRISKKTFPKPGSIEKNICCSRDCTPAPVEISRNEGPKINKVEQQKPLTPSASVNLKKNVVKQRTISSAKDVSCQCPDTKLVTVDMQSQCSESDWSKAGNKNYISSPVRCYMPPPVRAKQVSDKDVYPQPSKYVNKDVGKKRSDVTCQCSLQAVPRVDTGSQYKQNYRNVECHCIVEKSLAYGEKDAFVNKEPAPAITPCVTCCPCPPTQQMQGRPIQKPLKTSTIQASTDVVHSRFVKISSKDNALQTSDNSIDLEGDGVPKYPLFMKIVYADRLKEERPRLRF